MQDGEEAPAPIGFLLDDSDDKVLPPIRSNYFGPEPVIQGLLQRFLAEYVSLVSGSNRLRNSVVSWLVLVNYCCMEL